MRNPKKSYSIVYRCKKDISIKVIVMAAEWMQETEMAACYVDEKKRIASDNWLGILTSHFLGLPFTLAR